MNKDRPQIVVLFDGVCVLCNRTADFILRHDRDGAIKLGALQSPAGQERLRRAGLPTDYVESLVVIDGERVLTKSSAAIRIARELGFPWHLASALRCVPVFIRDAIYDWIAKNRYRWFGKRESCRLPTDSERDRFLS
ncbi:MAG: thiol-disulfide oxidoreductase DCC family protein [Candidatus Hydrogenedentes bacterium]|nr:thiol-disulfide oxidoreductase DCC family protein [Candidatus Hydrogenedentota bacterium]